MLIGSGTGVSTWLVTKLTSPGVVKTSVTISWSAYPVPRVVIGGLECTVSVGGVVAPVQLIVSLLRIPGDAGDEQYTPGGVFPLFVSTQFALSSVPLPTIDVNWTLAVQLMLVAGGMVGKLKFGAENQSLTVVFGAVEMTSTVLPAWFALGKGDPPGELECPLRVLIVTGPETMGLGAQVVKVSGEGGLHGVGPPKPTTW
jgi:hypothetical protein